jgi:hypothetical protein
MISSKNIKLFLLCLCGIGISQGYSQVLLDDNKFSEKEEAQIQMRVKQIDEFFDRFNFETHRMGNNTEDSSNSILRTQNLLHLFNENLFGFTDQSSRKNIKTFIDSSVFNHIKLKYEDTTWYAELHCKVNYNGKNESLTLLLQPEKITDYEYKWVICAAHADFMNLLPKKENPKLKLSPVDHQLNFMSLSEMTKNQEDNIIKMVDKDYYPDELSIFLFLVKTAQLKIEYVDKLDYHFLQVPGYIFTVSHFERNSSNVGWLISKVESVEASKKNYYKLNPNKISVNAK